MPEKAPKELRHAVRAGNLEIVKRHVQGGKYANSISNPKVGSTLLFASAQCGHAEVAKHLIADKADVNTCIKSGASALYTACFRGHVDVIELLLQNGANVNKAKKDGATPLFAAAQQNQSKVTQLLVDANADPTLAMASSGTTPAAIAQKNGHAEVMEVIQKAAPASAPPAEEPEEQVEEAEPEEQGTVKSDAEKARIDATFKDSKYINLAEPDLGGLEEDDAEQLYRMVECVEMPAGTDVLQQGTTGEFYYGIESGACEVLVDDKKVHEMGAGVSFGEISLIHGTPCSATIRVTSDAKLWRVDEDTFLEVRQSDGEGFVGKSPDDKRRIDETFAGCRWIDFGQLVNPELLYTSMIEDTRKPGDGGDLITQGEDGKWFYGIEDGECEVLVNGKAVGTLGAGTSFGELALMNKTKCSATIRVTKTCKLWKLDQYTFEVLLMRNANSQLGRLKSFLTHVALLQELDDKELGTVAEQLKEISYGPGDAIIEEGAEGSALYIVDSGTARATKKGTDAVLMEYEKGEWFGELALMKAGQKRSATVTAVDAVKCLELPRETFEAFMGKCEDIVKRDMEKYDAVNNKMRRDAGEAETPRHASARQKGRIDGSMEFLAELQSLPGGANCADCGEPKPNWGSSNTGALICLACSGVHRLIGAHNSKMLSVKLDAWEPDLQENMRLGNDAVNARLEAILKPEDKPKDNTDREKLEDFIHSKYVAKNFMEGGSGKIEIFPARAAEEGKRSESNIGMIVMIGVVFTTIESVEGVGATAVEGQIVGAPRPGETRNKPKKAKKVITWNEMIQLQASQGSVESRPNTLNLKVKKGKKEVGVAYMPGRDFAGIDLSDLEPDTPKGYTALLKVKDKKKGLKEVGKIRFQCNFALIDQ